MAVNVTVLFGEPQREVATMICDRLEKSTASSIVTGFATPKGLDAISKPLRANPASLAEFIVGAATYPAFEALDKLIAKGIPRDRLLIHLGHTQPSRGKTNRFARFHPMLHSKIYFMKLPNDQACAFIGSHNVTEFALTGLNGEAGVLLEGLSNEPVFKEVQTHIKIARDQATTYDPYMKEAYAWWAGQYIKGLGDKFKINDRGWRSTMTILVLAAESDEHRPKVGERIYFEIPEGIKQLDSVEIETHLFLFKQLPRDPWDALARSRVDTTRYTCKIISIANEQPNQAIKAQWRLEGEERPRLAAVPGHEHRPNTRQRFQQALAKVEKLGIVPFEYAFHSKGQNWRPVYAGRDVDRDKHADEMTAKITGYKAGAKLGSWRNVKDLLPDTGTTRRDDALVLFDAAPSSGEFVLVSLRRRRKRESDSNSSLYDQTSPN